MTDCQAYYAQKKTHHTLCGDRSFISKVAQNELHVFVFDLQYSLQLETSKTGYHTLFCPDNETFSQWNTLIPFIYSSDWIIDNSHVIAYAIYAHTQKKILWMELANLNLRQNFQKFACPECRLHSKTAVSIQNYFEFQRVFSSLKSNFCKYNLKNFDNFVCLRVYAMHLLLIPHQQISK